ncbi:bHLH DNA-binding protein that promotes hyphal development [Scheffersomyces xylosifermentans]|uniref:bHLH DNA-binding protein that promotes hyphal development n=1 Tax=Scheffersomyces xylosifermentans TaxID=1304137 RepID=UPI00315D74D1
MTDFDTTAYFNFETADDFLFSVSGPPASNSNNNNSNNITNSSNAGVSFNIEEPYGASYSPSSSGDESYNKYNAQSVEWSDNNTNNEYSNDFSSYNQDYVNPNYQSEATSNSTVTSSNTLTVNDNDLFKEILQNNSNNNTLRVDNTNDNDSNEFKSSSMSSAYSQDGISLVSHALSSTHTSPEPPTIKSESLDGTLIKREDEGDDEYENDTSSLGAKPPTSTTTGKKKNKVTKPKGKDKTSHNMIEKKYRTNINSKILALRDAVPALRIAAGGKDVSMDDLEGLTPASKLNKASVLTKATEYIKHLESKNDILKEQNLRLQRLIQEANNNPGMAQLQQVSPTQGQIQGGFGYYPPANEHSFNTVQNTQQFAGNNFMFNQNNQQFNQQLHNQQLGQPQQQHIQPQQPQYAARGNNKYLLGGMAAVMGTSLFAGGGTNDFKSLSALPFAHLLPHGLTNPSPLTLQLWSLMKVVLVLGSLASIFVPYFKRRGDSEKSKNNQQENVFISWILVSLGFQLPTVLSDEKKKEILSRLNGGARSGVWSQLLQDYLLLSTSESNFENCFLNILVGRLLVSKFPFLAKVFNRNLSIRGSLILNLEYKGDNKSLTKLNNLIDKIDGLSLLGSEQLISRLTNLINGKNINSDIQDGQNHVKYVEFYQDNFGDYYGILVNWRLLEIIHQLVLTYLANINKDKTQIFKDLKLIDELVVEEESRIYNYFKLFKTIVNSNDSGYLLISMNKVVNRYLQNFRFVVEGPELTDHEIFNTSDEEDEEEEEIEEVKLSTKKFIPSLRSQRSLISSLNLVSEEQFTILASSLVLYYYKNEEPAKALKLSNYLRASLSKDKLTLLSFASLLTLINEVIPGQLDESEVLDSSIKVLRAWLNDAKFLDFKLRSNLSELIVNKAMIINGIETNETDED